MRKKQTKKLAEMIERHLEQHPNTGEPELSVLLETNEAHIREMFDKCDDLVVHKLQLPGAVACIAVYLNILVDEKQLHEAVLNPLLRLEPGSLGEPDRMLENLPVLLMSTIQMQTFDNMNDIAQQIVHGSVILFFESHEQAFGFRVTDPMHRPLQEPSTEAVIRGPRLGFVENVEINMALLRQYIRSPRLKMERMTVGKISRSDVTIAYLESYAPQTVIDDVKKRISQMNFDSAISSGYLEEMISDHPYSPFPVIQSTERPDTVAASMISGKVAVLFHGSPMTLVLPVTFWFGFQSAEDYYMSFVNATMLRWLRFLFAFMAMVLPAFFVAITTYHQEMIPTSLVLSVAAAREVVPFPAMVEMLAMEITFEALREAGVRLPRPVGQTVSIVGALVIGQAAVQAGFFSAPIIIIVAMTAIASFLIPHVGMTQAVSMMRFPMIVLGGTFGFYGIGAGLIALLIHLTSLHSFGLPYMWPLAPFNGAGLADVMIRAPWRVMHKRQIHIQMQQEIERK